MSESLADLFPDADFRFHLTLRRGEPEEYFRPRDPTGTVRAERARWLSSAPQRYAATQPELEAPLREFAAIAASWAGVPSTVLDDAPSVPALLHRLGTALEPDLLFLTPAADGQFRLRGGALCFPTGWALEEKLGHTLDFIHGVVPGLNGALASPIHQFLTRLRPGTAFLRDNWGIAASPELNLHPVRGIPPPRLPVNLDDLWLRVEHQALLALPNSRGVFFGIRIALHRMSDVAASPHAKRVRRALDTMPGEVVAYKRVDQILPYLLNVL
jgi:hypothetical protein